MVGILSKKEEGFKLLQEKSILDNLISLLYSNILQNVALKVSYIRLLNDLVNHDAGCNWAIETNHWKTVVDLYFQDSNFYIEQEGNQF